MHPGNLIVVYWVLVSAHGRILDDSPTVQPNVNQRCDKNSVTVVSCAEIRPWNSLVPHPDDCQLFYYCIHPLLPPICAQCPSSLHFNPILHVCDWPYQAGCQVKATTTGQSTVEYVTTAEKSKTTYPTTLYLRDTTTTATTDESTTGFPATVGYGDKTVIIDGSRSEDPTTARNGDVTMTTNESTTGYQTTSVYADETVTEDPTTAGYTGRTIGIDVSTTRLPASPGYMDATVTKYESATEYPITATYTDMDAETVSYTYTQSTTEYYRTAMVHGIISEGALAPAPTTPKPLRWWDWLWG